MLSPIIIVGPTSSGKTSLSLWLAEQLGDTDILVVDSKQAYREQDITTGKDIPENFKIQNPKSKNSYYSDGNTSLFGIDIVEPNQEWSIAQFLEYAKGVIEQSKAQHRQLIIVGGTPQYTLSLCNQPESVKVPPNLALRAALEHFSVEDLQKKVSEMKLATMNESDRQNPRRLVRAIEVETSPRHANEIETLFKKGDVCWIGLELTKEKLEKKIRRRVIFRVENGASEEYSYLQEKYRDWRPEARAAIGYTELGLFESGKIHRDELVNLWTLHEVQYAKRQMQWWKRETQIQWFDALDPDLKSHVLQSVKACYN